MKTRAPSFLAFGLVAVVLASIPGACGGGATGGTGAGGSSSKGPSSSSGSGTGGGIGISTGSGGAGGGGTLGCSADLHSVVDATGMVVQMCPPDQGCASGACVPACQAAAASKGNVGCDFLVPTPPSYPPDLPPCFAVFIANTWPEPASLTVAFGGTTYDVTQFALAQVMPTANLPGGSRPGATAPMYPPNLGDEEFTVVLPPGQFLSKYVFFTDPTYPTTNLVLTRVAGPSGFEDVTVGCLGTVSGWQPVGSSGKYEVTNVDLLRAGVASGTCTNGRQTAQSAAPFGVVVWGEDSYSSYAYPAGGTAVQLTDVTVPPTPK